MKMIKNISLSKKIALIVASFCAVFFLIALYLYISSPDYIVNSVEKKMGSLTHVGAKKSDVIQFLNKYGYDYNERSHKLGNYLFISESGVKGTCLDSKWECHYSIKIDAYKSFFGFTDPILYLDFAFDEGGRLVDYSANVSYTFL